MRAYVKASAFLILGLLALSFSVSLRAATVIYDNSQNDILHRFNPGTLEVGDQIVLAGSERYLTMFSFEFWGTNTAAPDNSTFAGAVEARVQFYKNDGTLFNGYATPDNAFYDSGWFGGFTPTARSTFIFTDGADFPTGGLLIPVDEMTWSVQFRGMDLTDTVGVDLYSPPEVGQNYDDYWQNNGGWTLLTNGVPMDFAAKMEAVVPEPSSIVLSLVGGLGILALARRLRRNN